MQVRNLVLSRRWELISDFFYLKTGPMKALSKLHMDVYFSFMCVDLTVSQHPLLFPLQCELLGKTFPKEITKSRTHICWPHYEKWLQL